MLDPIHDRVENILRLRSGTATAMPHAWRHEEPREFLRVRIAAMQRLHNVVVVLDRSLRDNN